MILLKGVNPMKSSNGFKALMKRLKTRGVTAGVLAIIVAVALGTLGCGAEEKPNDNVLTLKTVVKTFKAEGMSLKADKSGLADNQALEGIKPAIYNIGDKKDLLLIYAFESFGEKKEILRKTGRFEKPFSFEEFPFHAKNILIVLKPEKPIETKEELERVGNKLKLIREIVFRSLNEGKERVYKGESDSWEGTLTLKYYEHWFQDDGTLRRDSYYEDHPVIKYKKAVLEKLDPISLEYRIGNSKRITGGATVNEEGYIEIGGGISNSLVPSEDDEIPFIIKWGDQEEEIILKAL